MDIFWGEFAGTAFLVLLGNGVVANVHLKQTTGNGSGWLVITTGWGLAVALAAYSVGRISGAHLNPAVTLGFAAIGNVDAAAIVSYLGGQMLGAMVGATLVWLTYMPHWAVTDDAATTRSCFCTGPAIASPFWNFFAELMGTGALVFGILAIGANVTEMEGGEIDLSTVFSSGIAPLLVGLLVWSIGLSLGGPTGYAINPARDLGPRLVHAMLPIAGKGDSNWSYAWTPVAGPIAGGVIGAWLFRSLM